MKNNRKGIAMMLVLSLILMLLVLGGAALMISTGHFRSSYHQMDRGRAYYAGEAAMQHVLWDLRTNGVVVGPYTLPVNFNVNGINDDDAGADDGGADIDITIGALGGDLPGVHRIDIVIDDYERAVAN